MKQYFPIPFVTALFLSSVYSLYILFTEGFPLSWLGTAIAVIPMLGLFTYIALSGSARVTNRLYTHLSFGVLGTLVSLWDFNLAAFTIALFIGVIATALYLFWYTPFDRSHSHIVFGNPLPPFSLQDIGGNTIHSDTNNGRNKVWIFIRGNWCPLCVSQVKEIAAKYQELSRLDTDLYIVSSQSEIESKKLAGRFEVPIQFLVDKDNQAAKALGIEHLSGVPFGIPGFDGDTAMPTVVITDKNNRVIFADQTNNYRIRPEPDLFILAIRQASQQSEGNHCPNPNK